MLQNKKFQGKGPIDDTVNYILVIFVGYPISFSTFYSYISTLLLR